MADLDLRDTITGNMVVAKGTNKALHVFASATDGDTITPNDTGTHVYSALWIGGAGSGAIKVDMSSGTTLTFTGVPAGFFPVSVTRVYSAGTNVTNIIGLVI